ncbi:MAG TPA: hypothetical protein VHK91_04150 [Flavisolibacter sp.]|jgi:hypothetical protein|nr:hypothetical protein [Flavisolibacter sp.]
MIIWKGMGFLVLVVAVAVGALMSLLFESAFHINRDWGAATGALVSAGIIWYMGRYFNAPSRDKVLIDKATGQEVVLKPDHSLFFIKMQYWAFIIGGIGVVMLIDLCIHGKQSF